MKKLTLLFVAAALLTGGAYAQDKACCKKNGGHCTKACAKDKKVDAKTTSAKTAKTEAPKKTS